MLNILEPGTITVWKLFPKMLSTTNWIYYFSSVYVGPYCIFLYSFSKMAFWRVYLDMYGFSSSNIAYVKELWTFLTGTCWVHWIVLTLGSRVIDCFYYSHCFASPLVITISSFYDLQEKLWTEVYSRYIAFLSIFYVKDASWLVLRKIAFSSLSRQPVKIGPT